MSDFDGAAVDSPVSPLVQLALSASLDSGDRKGNDRLWNLIALEFALRVPGVPQVAENYGEKDPLLEFARRISRFLTDGHLLSK